MNGEERYARKRKAKAWFMSLPFYISRICPINSKKIVFTCIEGTTGYTCNPKYIAEELMRRGGCENACESAAGACVEREEKDTGGCENEGRKSKIDIDETRKSRYDLVWLVNDTSKEFPAGIRVCRNTLLNRAYQLSTARVWIDNSRKQLECRKRKGQLYIQTWHAKLGFKPTCLDRGASFSKIAYLVSKHDSDMVDYWLSNSDWYDRTLKNGSLYEGKTLRTGSPRCDILVRAERNAEFKESVRKRICERFGLEWSDDVHFLMYAPTFREDKRLVKRTIGAGSHFPDYERVVRALESRFGGRWIILLRLHPQLVARNVEVSQISSGNPNAPTQATSATSEKKSAPQEAQEESKTSNINQERPTQATSATSEKKSTPQEAQGKRELPTTLDASRVDDMYEILAGCDAFLTDYSSAAFDAAVMKIPVLLYCDDYDEYEGERGKLLWNLRELPFLLSENDDELESQIMSFDEDAYLAALEKLMAETGVVEDGEASRRVADFIEEKLRDG